MGVQTEREEFERQGRKDKNNWCWYTWQVLHALGREMDWTVEHTGEVWLQAVKRDIVKREEAEWRQTSDVPVSQGRTQA